MADDLEETRRMWQERLDKNEILFQQQIDAPMKVMVTKEGGVLIDYPFQLANFEKAGRGVMKFSPLAAQALKAALNASDSIPVVAIGEDPGKRSIN